MKTLTLILVLWAFPLVALAQDEPLKGIRELCLLFEDLEADQRAAGMDQRSFETAVELKLRLAGIGVATPEGCLKTRVLYVTINSLHDAKHLRAAYSIRMSVYDVALLPLVLINRWGLSERSVKIEFWSTAAVGFGDADYVQRGLEKMMDQFLVVWLNGNPK